MPFASCQHIRKIWICSITAFQILLKITSSVVIVMDADMHEVVRHKRLYGDEHERMDWLPYLTYIARKPRSLRNSGIYVQFTVLSGRCSVLERPLSEI